MTLNDKRCIAKQLRERMTALREDALAELELASRHQGLAIMHDQAARRANEQRDELIRQGDALDLPDWWKDDDTDA